jgi:hypothetical protein
VDVAVRAALLTDAEVRFVDPAAAVMGNRIGAPCKLRVIDDHGMTQLRNAGHGGYPEGPANAGLPALVDAGVSGRLAVTCGGLVHLRASSAAWSGT